MLLKFYKYVYIYIKLYMCIMHIFMYTCIYIYLFMYLCIRIYIYIVSDPTIGSDICSDASGFHLKAAAPYESFLRPKLLQESDG